MRLDLTKQGAIKLGKSSKNKCQKDEFGHDLLLVRNFVTLHDNSPILRQSGLLGYFETVFQTVFVTCHKVFL